MFASDKSEGMLQVAGKLIAQEGLTNIHLRRWDILDKDQYPFTTPQFDLIISSVVIPYLDDAQAIPLIARLISRLAPGGVLAFVEQDWMTDTVNFPRSALARQILGKDQRSDRQTLGLGLRPVLRDVGLRLLPQRSFLWTDDSYGAYTRDLLERFADAAFDQGRIHAEERDEWLQTLNAFAASGDFFYGIVYHLIAGRRTAAE